MATLNEDEMLEGYLDGFRDDRASLPASMGNRSDAYVFGWLNGRDDRVGRPREGAWALKQQARKILEAQSA